DGNATFTIVVSSTIITSPRQRTISASQRLLAEGSGVTFLVLVVAVRPRAAASARDKAPPGPSPGLGLPHRFLDFLSRFHLRPAQPRELIGVGPAQSSRSGRPKRSNAAAIRTGSSGCSGSRAMTRRSGSSVDRTMNAVTSLIPA